MVKQVRIADLRKNTGGKIFLYQLGDLCLQGYPPLDIPALNYIPRHVCKLLKGHQGDHMCIRHGYRWSQ